MWLTDWLTDYDCVHMYAHKDNIYDYTVDTIAYFIRSEIRLNRFLF